jgi:hypothetical protein
VDWEVPGYIARRELAMVSGPPESLKSWLMADLARAKLTGSPWLGRFPVSQGTALYVEQERASNLVYQVDLLEQGHGQTLDGLLVLPPGTFLLTDDDSRTLLGAIVREHRPTLVVINSFRSTFRGKPADGVEVAAALGWLGQLAEREDFACVMIDQANKPGGLGLVRGMAAHADSLQKEYEADAVLHIERDRDAVGHGIGPARLYVGKRRVGEAGEPFSYEVRPRGDGVEVAWVEEIGVERNRSTARPETAGDKVYDALRAAEGPLSPATLPTLPSLKGKGGSGGC